jgi:hypothetical protein
MKYPLLILALYLPTAVFTQTQTATLPADHPTHLLGDPTGNDYLSVCEAVVNNLTNQPSGHLECRIWFSAVQNGFFALAAEKGMKSLPYSIPHEVTNGQMEKVVVKYMNDHPKDLHVKASLLVLWALQDAYPPRPSPAKK